MPRTNHAALQPGNTILWLANDLTWGWWRTAQTTCGYFLYTNGTLCLMVMINQRPEDHRNWESFSRGNKYWQQSLWQSVDEISFCGPKCWTGGQTDGQINQAASLSFGLTASEAKRETRGHERKMRDTHRAGKILECAFHRDINWTGLCRIAALSFSH